VLSQIQLVQQREGADASVGTRIPDIDGRLFASDYAYIDVHVRMPAELALSLRDSSGDLEVSKLTNGVRVKDSSGDIRLHDLGGSVDVTDTSGDIIARRIAGDFTVSSDSSGDIVVDDVKGSAIVKEDSSGDIELRHVGGDARVDRDSSGDIDFVDIGRDAIVGVDGSGGVTADGVKGNFTVGAKSGRGGEIRQPGVAATVALPPDVLKKGPPQEAGALRPEDDRRRYGVPSNPSVKMRSPAASLQPCTLIASMRQMLSCANAWLSLPNRKRNSTSWPA
jgi:hypothetical protein